ncbi:B12-binding domain-containing radical SAM protein [Magnetospirillum sp. UT-4]|uniref:B12-binding domain-containing radical SAM protein n=1 Tax=Magnetospirillum sp. UT-4 TaxID=2681467 RepID=UPI001384EF3E|nr:radical SAM protein [Magnetospirillum sp. UT-4]CAA7618447.1 putative Radical SAM protein [Magnetospirillum sp. UT-4]
MAAPAAILADDPVRAALAARVRAVIPAGCRRLLLVQPPPMEEEKLDLGTVRRRRYYAFPPYALGVLCTNLEARGYSVDLLDLNYEVLAMARDLDAADPKAAQAAIRAFWRRRLEEEMERVRPDLIGFSCVFTMTHEIMLRMARAVKEIAPAMPVAAGGVHVTNAPEAVLREAGGAIDLLALFESDRAFADLLDFANGKAEATALSQLAALVDGTMMSLAARCPPSTAEIEIVPRYPGLPLGDYAAMGEIGTFRHWREPDTRCGAVLSNRGCRANCTFCSVRPFNGPGVRGRSVASVVAEIEDLKDRYGITHIVWLDDDLFYDEKRAIALFDEIVKRNLGITWDASNGIICSAAAAHPELIHAAAASGCTGMYFGIESGNTEILRKVRKPSSVKHYLKVGEIMRSYPQIFTRGFMIMGFPGETVAQMKDTVTLTREMDLDWYNMQLLTPLPSTPIYREMVEAGLIEDGSLNKDGESFTLFMVRESERQKVREEKQVGPLQSCNLDDFEESYVPTLEELHNLWLGMDYEVNYGRILDQHDPAKLIKARRFLTDVCTRMSLDNPLAALFLALVCERLGDEGEAARRRADADRFLASPYWRQRFDALRLNHLAGHA